jgi:hypothetical protein
MSVGVFQVFYKTMVSGGTSTSGYDFGRAFQKVYLEIPSLTSGTDFYLQASSDGSTFRRLMQPVVNTSSVQVQTFVIGSAATNRIVEVPAGHRYMKVEVTTALTDTVNVFKFICGN